MAAIPGIDILDDVLGGRLVEAATLRALVRGKRREGLHLEYKRGKWLDAEKGPELRRHTSGLANAEGGVLIVGIVGDEDSQGADKWTFEGPVCPDKGGWDAWLGRVLSDVAARTRVAWQVVSVEEVDVVVIAVNRAEALIRLSEKSKLICHLRVGEQTMPIDESLFNDLTLGRRTKPDLALEDLHVLYGADSVGPYVNVDVTVHNQGLLWVPDLRVGWIGYATNGARASTSLTRQIEVHHPVQTSLQVMVGVLNYFDSSLGGLRSLRDGEAQQLAPFERKRFSTKIEGLPEIGKETLCAWYGAIFVVPKDGSPLWAQLEVRKEGSFSERSDGWPTGAGTRPLVTWFEGPRIPTRDAVFNGGEHS